MKSPIYKLFLLVFSVSILFSSCDDLYDDELVESSLIGEFNVLTDPDGYFRSQSQQYSFYDLAYINPRYDEIREIRIQDCWTEIYADFFAGDKIEALKINVSGVGTFICPDFIVASDTDRIILDNGNTPGYYEFMSRAMNLLTRTGNITITISGYYNVGNAPVDFVLKNDLDVFITEY